MYDAFNVFNVSVFGFLAIPPEDKEIKTNPPPTHTHTICYYCGISFDQCLYCTVGMFMKVCKDRILVKSKIFINLRKKGF